MSYLIRDEHKDDPGSEILFGLTNESPNEERVGAAFEAVRTTAFAATATVNEGVPANRVIEYNLMADGRLAFATSNQKRFYRQLKEDPRISLAVITTNGWIGVRIDAEVVEVTEDANIREEYFEKNPGTKKMFRHGMDAIAIFELVKGHGDMYHLYDSDHIRRLRFSFGGDDPAPLLFRITDACIGCGQCADHCAEGTIYQKEDGKYAIDGSGCEECGICYSHCPLKDTALVRVP